MITAAIDRLPSCVSDDDRVDVERSLVREARQERRRDRQGRRLAEVRLNTRVSGDRAPGGKARTCTRFQVLVDRRAQKSWASS